MNYTLFGILAYLVLGVVLTRSVLRIPRRRLRLRDMALGALFMPVLFVILLLSIFFEDLWKRLLIALDFNPPEEMRAGPDSPGGREGESADSHTRPPGGAA